MQKATNNSPVGSIIFLVLNGKIQSELSIEREQMMSIKDKFEKLKGESMSKIQELQKLPDSQKTDAKPAVMQEIKDKAYAILAEVLRADQNKRFQQIRLQYEGFLDEAVSSELSLTKEQFSNLKVKLNLHKGMKSPIAEDREKAIQELMDTLSEQQATKWRELIGEYFEFDEPESQTSNAPREETKSPLSKSPQPQRASSHTPPADDPFSDEDIF